MLSVIGIIFLLCVVRIFVTDRFIINGRSMTPTLKDGKALYVNKLLMGARIYTDFDFSKGRLRSCRLPGVRKCAVGDVIVFNYPFAASEDSIKFLINCVLTKRVVGRPGDTIRIENSHLINSSSAQTGIPVGAEIELKNMSDSILGERLSAGQFAGKDWTIKSFGPYVIPAKGMRIRLDTVARRIYQTLIRHEMNCDPQKDECVYTFKKDYYFVVGDYLTNSNDSRYFGPIPEDYIVGIVPISPGS